MTTASAPSPTSFRHGLAAFDFDGTISRRDTLGGFLIHVAGRRAVATQMARRGVPMARSLLDDELRDRTKESLLGSVLAGREHVQLIEAGRRYAASLHAQFRPEALERVRWHRARGHRLVIVSASLRYYLEPVAETLGFDHVIGVGMELDDSGRLTGNLDGPNVRAGEKAARLRSWISELEATTPGEAGQGRTAEIWAYGNSSGDEALLDLADHPVWMGRRAGRQPS